MSVVDSFERFLEKYGPGNQYASFDAAAIETLRKESLPEYYVAYLEQNGLREFRDGFWWFTDPLDLKEELAPFAAKADVFPVLRNAFGCFLVLKEGHAYHLDPHTRVFVPLGKQLAIVVNMTPTDGYALRDMYYEDYFQPALQRLGRVGADEMYAFAPALAIGGTLNAEALHIVKMREHLAFLAQL